MKIIENGSNIEIVSDSFDIEQTLMCGQCFRANRLLNGFEFIAFNKHKIITQAGDIVTLHNTNKKEFDEIWCNYFDLNTDYNAIKNQLSFDEAITRASNAVGGIRILRQDPFEALISFIISQNNNIPRIRGTIEKLCERFGNQIEGGYAFPTVDALNSATKLSLQGLGLGYRDEYILDCMTKIANNEINLSIIAQMPLELARVELRKVKGIGAKVCECVLLFGFYKIEAFPIDTWIKKVLAKYYPDGFPNRASKYAGIAQQYLFHYERGLK